MAKKRTNPTEPFPLEDTGGLDNPRPALDGGSGGAPDDTFEATIPIDRSPIFAFVITLCKFPEDSTMVAYIDQQSWMESIHITTIGLEEVKDFHTVRSDGITCAATPMLIHLCLFKCFLLYYKRQCRKLNTTLSEDDVIYSFSRNRFEEYCGSKNYNDDLTGISKPIPASGNIGNVVPPGEMTVQELQRGVMRDKSQYADLKDDKYFTL
jgi:hypothetical protein